MKQDNFQELRVKQMTIMGALGKLSESPAVAILNAALGDFFLALVREGVLCCCSISLSLSFSASRMMNTSPLPLFRFQGKTAEAESLYSQSLKMLAKTDASHPDIGEITLALGTLIAHDALPA